MSEPSWEKKWTRYWKELNVSLSSGFQWSTCIHCSFVPKVSKIDVWTPRDVTLLRSIWSMFCFSLQTNILAAVTLATFHLCHIFNWANVHINVFSCTSLSCNFNGSQCLRESVLWAPFSDYFLTRLRKNKIQSLLSILSPLDIWTRILNFLFNQPVPFSLILIFLWMDCIMSRLSELPRMFQLQVLTKAVIIQLCFNPKVHDFIYRNIQVLLPYSTF